MCGVAGAWHLSKDVGERELENYGRLMTTALIHRGPDDSGIFVDPTEGLVLGHRRLSVVDRSEAGRQPMISSCRRFRLVYNGELYNTETLRRELESRNHSFIGHSDTEVLIEAISEWGLESALKRIEGIFAFAVYDEKYRRLWLARDRLGVKPMYYGQFGKLFIFGSELSALTAHDGWQPQIDSTAVCALLKYSNVPAPLSIYRGIKKLSPGELLYVDTDANLKCAKYWSLADVAIRDTFIGDARDALDVVEDKLAQSVRAQMVSDVPLGVFLSGGVDSTLITSMAQEFSSEKIKTFSIGFYDKRFDEAPQSRKISEFLGTDHHELYVSDQDALEVIPLLPTIYDEPFSDSSQIPTFLVSRLARQSVTVALSGDGGDELFAGYKRYSVGRKLISILDSVPRSIRQLVFSGIGQLPKPFLHQLERVIPVNRRPEGLTDRISKLAVLALKDPRLAYEILSTHWTDPEKLLGLEQPHPGSVATLLDQYASMDLVSFFQAVDLQDYLPNDLLTKVDRASMSNSLEVRVPFLDSSVVDAAFSTPPELKLVGGENKWILRQILMKRLPSALINPAKQGFGVPIADWLRGPLVEWASDYLNAQELSRIGINDSQGVIRRWEEHKSGRYDWGYWLWDLLMLQSWAKEKKVNL